MKILFNDMNKQKVQIWHWVPYTGPSHGNANLAASHKNKTFCNFHLGAVYWAKDCAQCPVNALTYNPLSNLIHSFYRYVFSSYASSGLRSWGWYFRNQERLGLCIQGAELELKPTLLFRSLPSPLLCDTPPCIPAQIQNIFTGIFLFLLIRP